MFIGASDPAGSGVASSLPSSKLREGRGWASGKVILFGEHVVVYGRPAIAAAIEQGLTVTVRRRPLASPAGTPIDERLLAAVRCAAGAFGIGTEDLEVAVDSELPRGVGLGSSAALSVALVRAVSVLLGTPLQVSDVSDRAFEIERVFHGHPSGIDNTVVAHGGLIAFTRGEPPVRLACGRSLPLVIAIGNTQRETRRVVEALRERWLANRALYERRFDGIAAIVSEARRSLVDGDLAAIGRCMDRNHAELAELGISTPELDDMIAVARRNGALGAKLTGGGGGGAIICVATDRARVRSALAARGWQTFESELVSTNAGRAPRESS